MSSDASRELLDSLPELKPGETFCFDCNPDVPCFNRCCAELTLPLTPYDVLRLRHNLGLGSEEFLATFTTLRSFPDTGFPLPMLRMRDVTLTQGFVLAGAANGVAAHKRSGLSWLPAMTTTARLPPPDKRSTAA